MHVLRLVLVVLLAATCALAKDLHDFTVKNLEGNDYPLSQLRATPVVLVVNVASACGYTDSNYRELQALQEKYGDKGFTALAFPCNQFGAQEPGTPAEIHDFVTTKYSVTFPVMGKLDVNGPHEDPLFTFLKKELDVPDLGWNFHKCLVVRGKPRKWYSHGTNPLSFEGDIVAALAEPGAGGSSGGQEAEL